MKNQYLFPVITFVAVLFSSCSSYQFATLNSSLEQPFADGFIFENDTLQLHYVFDGPNCPLDFNIYNKLDVPIRINLDQSSLIVNGESTPVNPSVTSINTEYSETSTDLYYNTYTIGNTYGVIVNNERSGFIPPKASIRLSDVNVCTRFLNTKSAIKSEKRTVVDANGKSYEVKAYDFTKETSPLYFRCFVSYSVEESKERNYIDNDFWVTSIYQTLDSQLPAQADRFYLTKSTGFSTVVGVAALTGLAIIAIDNYEPDQDESY